MPKAVWRRTVAPALVAAVAALTLASAASAKTTTVPVSGAQTVLDEDAGTFKMTGSLIGDWQITSFKEIATSPIYRAKGTEAFSGCLDLRGDGSCAGDPSGKLRFTFRYWAQFGENDALIWGSCVHPITGGTGAFAGATGVLAMVDTPTPQGVTTAYIGHVTLRGAVKSRARASYAAAPAC
jgi:hypothetical protein